MATVIIMPKQGQSVESCVVTKLHKAVGDTVAVGEILFSYETDKSAFDEEAKAAGTVLHYFIAEGDDVPCFDSVCIIGDAGEDVSSLTAGSAKSNDTVPVPVAATTAAPVAAQPVATVQPTVTAPASADGHIAISPRARGALARTGVDIADVTPSGAKGRITERDVIAAANTVKTAPVAAEAPVAATPQSVAATAAVDEYVEKKHTGVRKAIAKAMTHSLSSMAQLTLHSSADATELLAYRAKLKDNADKLGLPNITLNDMVLYAVSRTLKQFPNVNALYFDDVVREYNVVHLGVAMDSERGLLVPTIFNADSKSLSQIADASKAYGAAVKANAITPDALKGGTFTVTNLGALGVEQFTPVINPPQVAILGVGGLTTRLKPDGKPYQAMGLSLTFDHRAIDGAPAARYLQALVKALESFALLLSM